MKKSGIHGKYNDLKRRDQLKQGGVRVNSSFIKMETRFKISPKHPGGGRS